MAAVRQSEDRHPQGQCGHAEPVEKEWIPDDISYMLYYVIDTYIKTGKIESVETYQEKFMSKRKVEPNRNPEKIYEETQRGEND